MATLTWSTKPHIAQLAKRLSPPAFAAMVNAAFRLSHVDLDYIFKLGDEAEIVAEIEWRMSVMDVVEQQLPPYVLDVQQDSRASFPLRLRHADSYITERVALIG